MQAVKRCVTYVVIISGTRARVQEFRRCNIGKVKANAIVTRGGEAYNEAQIKAYTNLFVYAQQFYGRATYDEFK